MKWQRSIRWIKGLMLTSMIGGCCASRPVTYHGSADLQYYKDKTTAIEYANVDQPTPPEVVNTRRPHTIRDRSQDQICNYTLMEAVHTALANNKLIRTRTNGQQLLSNPQTSPSVYDVALRETGFLFGNRGVEAALSDFDATFTSSLGWGRNSNVSNSTFPYPGFVRRDNTGTFTSGIAKSFANGGSFGVNHDWNYLDTNTPNSLFASSYTGLLQAEYRQPLWAGAGVEYTRIAGPARPGFGSITGVSQGVTIARINTDISIADFENSVTTMVKDVEDLYWELYLAYRQYDAEVANQKSAHRSWYEVKARMDLEATGGSAINESQARENYLDARSRVETALSNLYVAENQLRKQIGLPVNDGRILRPADNPVEAEYVINWEASLLESLTRRVELRRQKWQIKSLELQRMAAENVVNPRLDFVSSYQLNGFGDDLLSSQTEDGRTTTGYNSAYSSLGRADQTGWGLGVEMSMPIGFRSARAQLHNTELQLVKARAALSAQELDISHELAEAVQRIEAAYITAQTQLDRKVAAVERAEKTKIAYDEGVKDATFDLVLRAQAASAAAEIAYFTALVNYNKAIAEYHWRRGTLLERSGVHLEEGEWTGLAYDDALRRAWSRSYGTPRDNLVTEPEEFSSPYPHPKSDLNPGVMNWEPPVENGVTIPSGPSAPETSKEGARLDSQIPPAPFDNNLAPDSKSKETVTLHQPVNRTVPGKVSLRQFRSSDK